MISKYSVKLKTLIEEHKLRGVQRLELMLLYQGLQLYGVFTDHGGISNRRQSKV